MYQEHALVLFKSKPALIKSKADGKITIALQNGETVKVREKDIEPLHPGPVKDFSGIICIDICTTAVETAIYEAWELMISDSVSYTLNDLASLVFGEYTPASAFSAYNLLKDGLYFSGNIEAITPRCKDDVEADKNKRGEKQRETNERASFLERLKQGIKKPGENSLLPADARFMQDIEALALGKSAKSRTMKELGLSETPEEAHSLLLKTGFWSVMNNPYPSRFCLSLNHTTICPQPPPAEDRCDLTSLPAFAIDSPWSSDPDDAISIDGNVLYVHIADPASSIMPDSPAEKEARDRGATIYLPETTVRMLADEALPLFALGLSEKSCALTFKITLNEGGEITETEIFPSTVKIQRITYEQASLEMDCADSPSAKALRAIYDLVQSSFKRRTAMGAVHIELPESRIFLENDKVIIEPVVSYSSAFLVRECMIIAGEGAGNWAAARGLAFPYINQEVEMQGKIPAGLAGSYQLRRCMRPRVLSIKPGRHQGLGLDTYSQVTSPLRRYTDLLAHMQIRAFLRGGKPLSADEVSAHLGFSEAAAIAVTQAERASNNHWTMVYLSGKKDSVWDSIALEKKGNRWAVVIPSIALETQAPLHGDISPNENIKLILKSVNIPKGEAVFVQA